MTDKMTIQEAITELKECYLIQSDDEGRRRNKAVTMAIESLSHIRIPPFFLEEIMLLNQELNRLYEENEKLKAKLYEIIQIAKEETK